MKIIIIISLRFPSSNESNSLSSSSSFVISIYILFGLYELYSFLGFIILSGLFDFNLIGLTGSKKSEGKKKWELYIIKWYVYK